MRDLYPFPLFWHDSTSEALRAAGPGTLLVAAYIVTNSSRNSIGFYRLPLEAISKATTLSLSDVQAAMHRLEQIGFMRYNQATEMIWIINWARQKLGQLRGNDKKRIATVNAEFAAIPAACLMRVDFFWKHALMLRLSVPGSEPKDSTSADTETEMPSDLVPQTALETRQSNALQSRDI
jgi:hypothetical protein